MLSGVHHRGVRRHAFVFVYVSVACVCVCACVARYVCVCVQARGGGFVLSALGANCVFTQLFSLLAVNCLCVSTPRTPGILDPHFVAKLCSSV